MSSKFFAFMLSNAGGHHLLGGDAGEQFRVGGLPDADVAWVELNSPALRCDPLRGTIQRHVSRPFGLGGLRQFLAEPFSPVRWPYAHHRLTPHDHVVVSTNSKRRLLADKQDGALVLLKNVKVSPLVIRDYGMLAQPVDAGSLHDVFAQLTLLVVRASSEQGLDDAFATLVQRRVEALIVNSDPFIRTRTGQIVALAARHGIPAIYSDRDYARAGGLISYGPSIIDAYRLQGVYAAKILKGEKPAELPVIQSSKFDFVINLKTAKSLGLMVLPGLLAIADEVIE